MFSKGDILTFGLAALAIALCTLGAIVGQNLTAQLVSAAAGLAFLVGAVVLIAMKVAAWSADFVTRRGLRVRIGKTHRPTLAQVEGWTDTLLAKLRAKYPGAGPTLLEGLFVVFIDAEKLSTAGRWVRGYADGKVAVVCAVKNADGKLVTDRLFGHEVGHLALGRLGVPWDEATQHKILADLGL